MSHVTILSDGGFGTALALTCLKNGHHVTQWGFFPDYIAEMKQTRKNTRFLKGVVLPPELKLTSDMQEALADAEIIILASPAQYLRGVLKQLAPYYNPNRHHIINIAKGIEAETDLRMSEVVCDVLGDGPYTAVSGPSHAEEVSRSVPTAIVAAGRTFAEAEIAQRVLSNDRLRIYTSDDLIGVELGGALKNVYAVIGGIADGLALGDNPKAALITRSVAEMARLGQAMGGQAATFSGLSGIGDLIVTAYSRHSRNRHVGEALGQGRTFESIHAEMGLSVAEGISTCPAVKTWADRLNISAPLCTMLYRVVYEKQDVMQEMSALMLRKVPKENEFLQQKQDDHA